MAHSPIEIVYHVATLNAWEEIVQEQLKTLETSNLAKAANRITLTVVGPDFKKVEEIVKTTSFADKVKLLYYSENPRFCEFPGIEKVQEIAKENGDANIFYFHSKGVTYLDPDKSRNVRSWRRFMEYFTIEHWKECIETLKKSNMCGVEWLNCIHTNHDQIEQPGFFAGNFWWATADYLRTCQPMYGTPNGPEWCFKHRFDCEAFINTGLNPLPASFHQSCVNMYQFNYAPEYYKKEPVLKDPIEIVYHIVATKQWQSSFQEQLNLLHTTDLLANCNRLTAIVLGPEFDSIQQLLSQSPYFHKMEIIHANSKLHLEEFPSLEMIKAIVRKQPHAKILYIHNHTLAPFVKPSSSIGKIIIQKYVNTKKSIKNCVKLLFGKGPQTNMTIIHWKECLASLQSADISGMKWKKGNPKGSHFADTPCHGYFANHSWWANADYLKKCQNPHYRSPYHLYCNQWSEAWLAQYFADCQMFTGTSYHEPIVHELVKNYTAGR